MEPGYEQVSWLPFLIISLLDLFASVAAGTAGEIVVLALLAHPSMLRELETKLRSGGLLRVGGTGRLVTEGAVMRLGRIFQWTPLVLLSDVFLLRSHNIHSRLRSILVLGPLHGALMNRLRLVLLLVFLGSFDRREGLCLGGRLRLFRGLRTELDTLTAQARCKVITDLRRTGDVVVVYYNLVECGDGGDFRRS